ncbi:MAG: 30S ribosomal protein S2 [Candidatus Omnitrophica bacterium]|nr:30S ribosomal protein S2 [Candidatus Omnitrophota bacterium]
MALPEELNKLLEAGVHFGHQAKRWNPKMKKFIFGKRSGIYIIDLEKTLEKIKEAIEFLKEVVKEDKEILFVGTKKQAQGLMREIAESCDMPYVVDRWVGGMLTNFSVIRTRVERYKDLLEKRSKGVFDKFPKKEVVRLNRELEKMERNFSGVKEMVSMPGVLFVVDPKNEILSVQEARKAGIPIVALIDTDSDPESIDYPIPGNDDALKSIRTVLSFIMDSIADLIAKRKNKVSQKQEAEESEKEIEAKEQAEEESSEEPKASKKRKKEKPGESKAVKENKAAES